MAIDDQNNQVIDIEPPASGRQKNDEQNQSKVIDAEDKAADTRFSLVAATPQHKTFIIVGIVAVTIGILYYIFFGHTPSKEQLQQQKEADIAAQKEDLLKSTTPVTAAVDTGVNLTPVKLPEPPPLTEPTPPEPPPPPAPVAPPAPLITQVPQPTINVGIPGVSSSPVDLDRQKAFEARRKAGVMVVGGAGGGGGAGAGKDEHKEDKGDESQDKSKEKKKTNYDFLGFGNGSLESTGISTTSAEQVRATKIANLTYTVAQGKVINAVLETAINTDLPGMLRAVVTRDVYAESSKNILIPKGSRVIGNYDSEVKDGQTRVAVIWSRIIRPDGIDVAVDSPGTDQLGRAGVSGKLDNKFWTRIGSAFLVSYVIPTLANKLANVNKNSSVSSTTTTGAAGTTTTNTSSFEAQQAKEASDKFSSIAQKAIESTFPTKPTITIDQGTRINIFVKKDLIIPSAYTQSSSQVMP